MIKNVDMVTEMIKNVDIKSNNFWFGAHPNTGTIITADGAATFRANSFKNMTEEDGARSTIRVTFETKVPF